MSTIKYTGARYLVKFEDSWSSENAYEPITAVQVDGFTYISKCPVPAGVEITNTDFWLVWADPNSQMEQLRQLVAEYIDDVETFDGRINDNAQAIADEITAREEAITAEAEAREEAITAEAEAREEADNKLQKIINGVFEFTYQNNAGDLQTPYGIVKIKKDKVKIGVKNNSNTSTYTMTSNPYKLMNDFGVFDFGHNCNFVGSGTIDQMPLRLNGVEFNTQNSFSYGAFALNTETQDMTKYPSGTYLADIPSEYDTVFMCSYTLIENGTIAQISEQEYFAPRLGFGWNNDCYFVMWCEGRELGAPGMTLPQFAQIAQSYGVENMYTFDGGGSICVCTRNNERVIKLNRYRDKTLPYPEFRKVSLCCGYDIIEED